MNRNIISAALGCFSVCILLAGCSNPASSKTDTAAENTSASTEQMAAQTETTTQPFTTEPETTSAATSTTTETVAEQQTAMLDRIADSLDEPTELPAPFGDISNAYVCFGGTAVYPSVYVLSVDEVKKLSKVLNSMEWNELPDKPVTPLTEGPSDLTLYINDNGKRSQLALLGDRYVDENGPRYFMIKLPSIAEENISVYELVSDLLFHGTSKTVSTHLYMQMELFKDAEEYDINQYWDLIWDDVVPFIEEGRE